MRPIRSRSALLPSSSALSTLSSVSTQKALKITFISWISCVLSARPANKDLQVQHIQNEFTVRVYEQNTFFAMKHCDYLQFNECLAKLLFLYRASKSENKVSFYTCRLLQFGLSGMTSELHKFLHELPATALADARLRRAFGLIEAANTMNYVRLLEGLVDTGNEFIKYLLGMFSVRLRVWALRIVAQRWDN